MLTLSANALAGDPRELQWADLVPETPAIENPFGSLTPKQLRNLMTLARMRDLQAGDLAVEEEDVDRAQVAMLELKQDGLDAMRLLDLAEEIYVQRKRQGEAVNEALDGQNVRIPGYLLPLEFDGASATEFLLVPYVGACIHTPPPPPNQIIQVTAEQGFESRGLYTPVWVHGRMRTESRTSELSFVDGASDISIGYVMEARQIELYTQ